MRKVKGKKKNQKVASTKNIGELHVLRRDRQQESGLSSSYGTLKHGKLVHFVQQLVEDQIMILLNQVSTSKQEKVYTSLESMKRKLSKRLTQIQLPNTLLKYDDKDFGQVVKDNVRLEQQMMLEEREVYELQRQIDLEKSQINEQAREMQHLEKQKQMLAERLLIMKDLNPLLDGIRDAKDYVKIPITDYQSIETDEFLNGWLDRTSRKLDKIEANLSKSDDTLQKVFFLRDGMRQYMNKQDEL